MLSAQGIQPSEFMRDNVKMKKVAFVMCRPSRLPKEWTYLYYREEGWARELRKKGYSVEYVFWDNAQVDWKQFDGLIIRTVSDYIFHIDEFREWLRMIQDLSVKLFNPPDVTRWNLHKSYLLDLQSKGVTIPESVFVNQQQAATVNLRGLMNDKGFEKAVVKPCIGCACYRVHLVPIEEANDFQDEFNDLVSTMDVVVQDFVADVTCNGEWALIYFDKMFSHAILKSTAPNDFRAFFHHGGDVVAFEPPESVRNFCDMVMAAIESPLLFGRVDVILKNDGSVVLIELELLDAFLYFDKTKTEKAEETAADVVAKFLA